MELVQASQGIHRPWAKAGVCSYERGIQGIPQPQAKAGVLPSELGWSVDVKLPTNIKSKLVYSYRDLAWSVDVKS